MSKFLVSAVVFSRKGEYKICICFIGSTTKEKCIKKRLGRVGSL